jgi:hypothetical protein
MKRALFALWLLGCGHTAAESAPAAVVCPPGNDEVAESVTSDDLAAMDRAEPPAAPVVP